MLIDFLFVGVHRHLPFFPVSQILFVFVFFLPIPMTICISIAFHCKTSGEETNGLRSFSAVLDANHPFDSNSTVAVLKIEFFSSFFSGVSLSMHLIRYVRWKKTVSSLGICSCGFFSFFSPLLSLSLPLILPDHSDICLFFFSYLCLLRTMEKNTSKETK